MGRPDYVPGIVIKFSSPIKFWMINCNSENGNVESANYEDFPVQPPDEVDKIWTFTKTDSALIVTCNGVEVLNYEFATSEFTDCVPKWGGNSTESIYFYHYWKNVFWNNASDFYRAGKSHF
eukprot:sb/3476114/